MKKLTIKEAVRLHRLMWDYIQEHNCWKDQAFEEVPELKAIDILTVQEGCFFCEYNVQHTNKCKDCIGEWSNGHCLTGEFGDAANEFDANDNTGSLIAVRDIPIKERYKRYL